MSQESDLNIIQQLQAQYQVAPLAFPTSAAQELTHRIDTFIKDYGILPFKPAPTAAPVIQNNTTPAPVAEPPIKQTVEELIPQIDTPTTQGQANKIPFLPIAAAVGGLLLVFAVVRKKRK